MMTKCEDSTSAFMQVGLGSASNSTSMRICQSSDGLVLRFDDPKLQAKVERMMTPDARRALREALGQVQEQGKVALFQTGANDQQPGTGVTGNTTTAFPTSAVETLPVNEKPHPSGQWKKCTDGTPNCGLLHDLMSIEWGRFRDSFDVLAKEMKQNQDAFDKFMSGMNEQLTAINNERTKHMQALASTISAINADTEEMNEKDEQKRDLQDEYDKEMATFRAQCSEILYTRICAVRKVRNQILWDSTVSPPSKISDCDFSDWAPKDGKCIGVTGLTIDCDDTCPQPDPYKCGGLETMKHDMVVAPNTYGMICPPFERKKKCNQFKCPVDCVESEWSGWSKCTKECEGGVTVRTRSILTKAKNGGKACDTVQEEEPCNTGSCDRDCTLDVWSDWTPCSMACGGGFTERARAVVIPIRGQGKCPRSFSMERYENTLCNTHACIGDEIGIARQDLVLTIDGSGSLRQSGFEIVRNFAANLTNRYQSEYYGEEKMRIGVVYFGNGHLNTQPDGTTTIEEALYVQGLTGDLQLVQQKIQAMTWLRGFTNMAQGFHMADVMLAQTGRSDCQSAVMVISDGKFSMEFQTAEKARELKDKNIQIYEVAITEARGAYLSVYRSFSSIPHDTNYVRIPGLVALKHNPDFFAQRVLVTFCPKAFSPSQSRQKEDETAYMMVHESGYPSDSCGEWSWHGKGFTMEDCAYKAIEGNRTAFSFGKGKYMAGGCYTEAISFDAAFYDEVRMSRRSPPCPNGYWVPNPYFDTYMMKPSTVPVMTR